MMGRIRIRSDKPLRGFKKYIVREWGMNWSVGGPSATEGYEYEIPPEKVEKAIALGGERADTEDSHGRT